MVYTRQNRELTNGTKEADEDGLQGLVELFLKGIYKGSIKGFGVQGFRGLGLGEDKDADSFQ